MVNIIILSINQISTHALYNLLNNFFFFFFFIFKRFVKSLLYIHIPGFVAGRCICALVALCVPSLIYFFLLHDEGLSRSKSNARIKFQRIKSRLLKTKYEIETKTQWFFRTPSRCTHTKTIRNVFTAFFFVFNNWVEDLTCSRSLNLRKFFAQSKALSSQTKILSMYTVVTIKNYYKGFCCQRKEEKDKVTCTKEMNQWVIIKH